MARGKFLGRTGRQNVGVRRAGIEFLETRCLLSGQRPLPQRTRLPFLRTSRSQSRRGNLSLFQRRRVYL